MRRAGGLWPRVVAFENLGQAARRAARGKRRRAEAARFLADLEPRALALQRELAAGTWRPGRPFQFEIHDPKRRTITAAPFPDRVVHHALMGVLEPVFERRMMHASFACRRGKGTHAALRYAQGLVRRHRWFLKLDVARCFQSLRGDIVRATLERAVKDRRVLALCARIVDAGLDARGAGLPIGNLSSQWFANLVLDRLDHFVLEELRVPGYLRYMDDFGLLADSKSRLVSARDAVEGFLGEELQLALKARATVLAPSTQGMPFLGWRVYRGMLRLRPSNRRRMRARVRHRLWEYRTRRIDEEHLCASLRSVCEHLRHGNTLSLRRRMFEGHEELPVRDPPPGPRRGGGPQATATACTAAETSATPPGTRARPIATTGNRQSATSGSASALPMHRTA